MVNYPKSGGKKRKMLATNEHEKSRKGEIKKRELRGF
jgi:hypothetical protein